MYVGDNKEPVIAVHELKRKTAPGLVGVKASNFMVTYFSNFSVTKIDNPPLNGKFIEPVKAQPNTIMAWEVSNTFAENSLTGKFQLNAEDKAALTWKPLKCESWGVANLSRLATRGKSKNTVFARITIHSDSDQVKALDFGYSDRIKVYINGRLIYGGMNNYMSRDYRYLGTIGFFDTVYLPLKKGKNELYMAVSESFGGWGIISRFKDMKGIKLIK
ncbi:MAG: hypothetical protein GY940_26905 [bacterium]|nr:hypothetical protein [bacterium]